MNFVKRLLRAGKSDDDDGSRYSGSEIPPSENADEKPCNISGHNFEPKYGPKYHAQGVAHFGRKDGFTVKKKTPEKCTKCGKYREREKAIGKIKVDKETDELTVVQ